MDDMAINRDSNGIIHSNKDRKLSKVDKNMFNDDG